MSKPETAVIRQPEKMARRKSDGEMFEPSHPFDWSDGDAIGAMFKRDGGWYFRRIVPERRSWWQLRPRWRRTGEVWEPRSAEFEVVDGATYRA